MSICVVDTDVVIAALDRVDIHHQATVRAISSMIEDRVELRMSTVNYAEALVRPAENEDTLRAAVEAIASFGVRLIAPTGALARDAATYRTLGISLADGFALATARADTASVASFDRRVRRAMSELGLELAAPLV